MVRNINIIIGKIANGLASTSWAKVKNLVGLYHGLLALSIDPRSKVRKESHKAIQAFFTHESGNLSAKRAGKITSKFILSQFLSENDGSNTNDKSHTIIHLFNLLSPIISYFPLSISNPIIDHSLKLIQSLPSIRRSGFNLFYHLFKSRPTSINQSILSYVLFFSSSHILSILFHSL